MSERKIWCHSFKDGESFRWWLHFPDGCFGIELARPRFSFGFGVALDGERTLSGSFAGFYWHVDSHKLARWLDKKLGRKSSWPPYDHSFAFYWFENGLWLQLWGNDYESRRDDPWWKRMHHLDFLDLLLGKAEYSKVEGERFHNVVIPMPERNFTATMTYETCTWKRPRWFAKVRKFTNIELADDAPKFPGKGENSWDQGDDSIYGMSAEGHSIPKAIGAYVEAVMQYRHRRSGMRALVREEEAQ